MTQYNSTQRALTDYLQKVNPGTLSNTKGFAFKESVSRWLMSIFIGFLLSLFVWQPLFDLIVQIIKVCRFDPEEVNESYFFYNTKLLLTQAEREALIQGGVNVGSTDNADNADKESDDENEDANSQERKLANSVELGNMQTNNNAETNVLDELDKQMAIEMIRSQVELMESRTP